MDSTEQSPDKKKDETHLSRLASVGQMAAGIAHEVRNPLTAVKGFLELLEKYKKPEYIDIAQSELHNALSTLDNLLQVSRPDKADEMNQPFSLSAELESILTLFQDQIYDIEVITSFKNTDRRVYGKKNQLKKVFFNLIKNAFESIEGVGKITVRHDTDDENVYLFIEDTGVGIPKDKLSMLGTPFFSTKAKGTGMGLTHVFSVVYQHGGDIKVESEENIGTTFSITIPIDYTGKKRRVMELDLDFKKGTSLIEFFSENRDAFEKHLLSEAVNVKDRIDEVHRIGNINLLENAHKLVLYITEGREHDLITFAKQEGIAWAKYSLTLAFKLEWVQAIRRSLWEFLYNFDRLNESLHKLEEFYTQEKSINEMMDHFLNHFFISYSKYKDELIETQREMVEKLSVPIIPITPTISILPLIGEIDENRAATIEDKVLAEVEISNIQTLIIDLSGVAHIESGEIQKLLSVIDGISMMGCKSVITGLRSELVKCVMNMGLSFEQNAETKGTLQQALMDYLIHSDTSQTND